MRAHRFDEALRLYGQAVREYRWEPAVLLEAARAYIQRRRHDKAEPLLERCLQISSDRLDVQMASGERFRMMGQFSVAEKCFRRALLLSESYPPAELELAHLCERTHRLEESETLCTRMIRRDPSCGPARVLLARVARRRGALSEAKQVLEPWLQTAVDSPLAAEAWGELALVFDESQQFDRAWQAIGRTKKMLLEHDQSPRLAAEHVAWRFGQMVEEITPGHFDVWLNDPNDSLQHPAMALLTGFPRSGTTLLERVLDMHPNIVSMEEKDILAADVFPHLSQASFTAPIVPLLDRLTADQRQCARDLFFSTVTHVLGDISPDITLLDKNPAMTMLIPVFLRLFPRGKLLVALRDPRDVILSCYLRYLPLNPVSVNFLTLERAAARYSADLRAWLKFKQFLPANWCEIRYEETVADLAATTRRCLDTLDRPWSDTLMSYREHLQVRAVLSPTYDAVSKPVYKTSLQRWKNYAEYLEPIRSVLDPLVEDLGY